MNKIQRYDIEVDIFALHGIGVSRCSDGDWVKWEDVEAFVKDAEQELNMLRGALSDLLSWFPDKPSPPEWRISVGASEAVQAARDAITIDVARGVGDNISIIR